MIYSSYYESPIGLITLASDGSNLVGLWLEDQKYYAATVTEAMIEKDDLEIFAKAKMWLDDYFEGKKPILSDLPLAPEGSDFRKAVWGVLSEIPYGTTLTYGEIAKKMALKMNKPRMSSQAVGGAVGHNPISVIIPCHRVVATDGSLTGYAGGVTRKVKLLELEEVDMTQLSVPTKGTAL